MSILNAWSGTLILPLVVATARCRRREKAGPPSGLGIRAKATPGLADPKKAEILNSDRWRKLAGYYEWVSACRSTMRSRSSRSTPIKHEFAKMSAAEVQWLLDDTESKLQILATQQAQDSLAWVAEDLAAYAPKKDEKRLKKMPDFATLNAAQLSLEIMKIQEKRASMAQTQALYQREQSQPHANPWDSARRCPRSNPISPTTPPVREPILRPIGARGSVSNRLPTCQRAARKSDTT